MLLIRFPNQVPHHRFGFSIGLGHGGLIFLDFYRKVGFRKIWFDHVPTLFRQGADELSKFFYLHRSGAWCLGSTCNDALIEQWAYLLRLWHRRRQQPATG